MSTPPPDLRDRRAARTAFRVIGLVLLAVTVVLLVYGAVDLFSSMSSQTLGGPHQFWALVVGAVLLAPAGWCLQAGFLGSAARYVAGETVPVIKDSAASYRDRSGAASATGPFCSRCGVRNDADAAICDGCGVPLAG